MVIFLKKSTDLSLILFSIKSAYFLIDFIAGEKLEKITKSI